MTGLALRVLAVAVLTATVAAQRTWIVDQNNGPGTDFTDLPPAVAAAANGDTILVRPGNYSWATTNKGLRLLGVGAPRPRLVALTVQGLPAGRRFTIQGIDVMLPVFPAVFLRRNQGAVHLDAMQIPTGLAADDCLHVTVNDCRFGGLSTRRSLVVVTETALNSSGLDARLAKVIVNRSTLRGRLGGFCHDPPAGPGLMAVDSTVFVSRNAWIAPGQSNCPPPAPGICAWNTELVIDPAARISGGIQAAPPEIRRDVPGLQTATASPGSTIQSSVFGQPGLPAAMALSLPIQPIRVPPFGWFGLDPLSTLFLGSGTTPPTGPWTVTLGVPSTVQPGLPVTFQAIVGTRLTPPTTIVIQP